LAVQAAQRAFPTWSTTGIIERSAILYRISQLIKDRLEQLALAESTDNGKPVALAREVDIPRSARNFEFFATAIQQFASESHANAGKNIHYTLRQPIGVVACISPWNLPLYLFSWKIAPALAAGNCVIAKPSEITPMSAYLLAGICKEAGLPDGVLNIIHGNGPETGAAMVAHPQVKAISFTAAPGPARRLQQWPLRLLRNCHWNWEVKIRCSFSMIVTMIRCCLKPCAAHSAIRGKYVYVVPGCIFRTPFMTDLSGISSKK
jgi:aminomuconate-semialdehyde/2-hydroxymuconate-6-semialdehyde dehydrogenase